MSVNQINADNNKLKPWQARGLGAIASTIMISTPAYIAINMIKQNKLEKAPIKDLFRKVLEKEGENLKISNNINKHSSKKLGAAVYAISFAMDILVGALIFKYISKRTSDKNKLVK